MLAVTVGLSILWSSFELPSPSNTSVMSNREPVVLLLPSWPSGTLDRDRARCLSLATALGKERRMLKPGLPAVCTESGPPFANARSPWPAPPLSSPLAVLAFAPISHAATDACENRRGQTTDSARRAGAHACVSRVIYYERTDDVEQCVARTFTVTTTDDIDRRRKAISRGRPL